MLDGSGDSFFVSSFLHIKFDLDPWLLQGYLLAGGAIYIACMALVASCGVAFGSSDGAFF